MNTDNNASGPQTEQEAKRDYWGCLFVLAFLIGPFVAGIVYSLLR